MQWRPHLTLESANAQQIDDEHEGASRKTVSAAGGSISKFRRANELTATANLHAGNALLPRTDELRKWEVGGLATIPGSIELFASFEINTDIVDVDDSSGLGFSSVADDEVGNDKFSGCRTFNEVDFWFLSHV